MDRIEPPVAADLTARDFARALHSGDAMAAAACFAPEARLLTADGTEVSGCQVIHAVLAQLVGSEVRLEIRVGRTLAAGDVALNTQYWRRVSANGEAERFERQTTASLVLGRRDRRWQVLLLNPWG